MPEHEKMWTVLSMLEWATDYFKSHSTPNPRLSIEWLLADVLGIRRLDLYLNYDRPLSAGELARLRPLVKRRGLHEPLQYIVGYTDFMNCRIEVDPAVLIPRVETEQLAEIILNDFSARGDSEVRLLDVGTGSGCIPVAIAAACPHWVCTGIDDSQEALRVAEKNARLNHVQIEFLHADLLGLAGHGSFRDRSFEVIVSNPPYVLPEEKDTLERQVVEYEPEHALFHDDPVDLCRTIAGFACSRLTGGGRLYLECNHRLARQVQQALGPMFPQVTILRDYDKKDRFVRAEKSV